MKKRTRSQKKEKRKALFKEFGDFLKRGNAINLAIGVVVGGAFQKIVNSLVNDIIMPFIGVIIKVNISEAKAELVPATDASEAVYLYYGAFIQSVINFLIIASAIFVAIKVMTKVSSIVDKTKLELIEKIKELKDEHHPETRDIEVPEEAQQVDSRLDIAEAELLQDNTLEQPQEIANILSEIRDLLKKE